MMPGNCEQLLGGESHISGALERIHIRRIRIRNYFAVGFFSPVHSIPQSAQSKVDDSPVNKITGLNNQVKLTYSTLAPHYRLYNFRKSKTIYTWFVHSFSRNTTNAQNCTICGTRKPLYLLLLSVLKAAPHDWRGLENPAWQEIYNQRSAFFLMEYAVEIKLIAVAVP